MRIPKSKVDLLFEEMALSGDVVKSRECIYLRKAFSLEDDTARRGAEILVEKPEQKNISNALKKVKRELDI